MSEARSTLTQLSISESKADLEFIPAFMPSPNFQTSRMTQNPRVLDSISDSIAKINVDHVSLSENEADFDFRSIFMPKIDSGMISKLRTVLDIERVQKSGLN